jgi:hypothetical protein
MNFADILKQLWFYLQVDSPTSAEIEQAVLQANLLQDQAMSRENLNGTLEVFSLSIDSGAVAPLRVDGSSQKRVYKLQEAWLIADTTHPTQRLRIQTTQEFFAERGRYVINGDELNLDTNSSIFAADLPQAARLVLQGESTYLFPQYSTTQQVSVLAYVRPPPLTAETGGTLEADNYILRHGATWLLWSLVSDLNYRYQIFTQRQEGTLPPPIAQAERAWLEFLAYDKALSTGTSANVY